MFFLFIFISFRFVCLDFHLVSYSLSIYQKIIIIFSVASDARRIENQELRIEKSVERRESEEWRSECKRSGRGRGTVPACPHPQTSILFYLICCFFFFLFKRVSINLQYQYLFISVYCALGFCGIGIGSVIGNRPLLIDLTTT